MNRSIAQVLSVLFHPLLMPTYLFYFILYQLPASAVYFPVQSRWVVLTLIVICTFIIPGLVAYAMVRAGWLQSMEMEEREQRWQPLLFTGLCYGLTTYMFYRQPAFDALFYFVLGIITASVLFTFITSFFWKISAHGVGIGGILGLLLWLNREVPDTSLTVAILLTILLAGALLSARLSLNAHTPAQVYAGFCSGLLLALSAGTVGSVL